VFGANRILPAEAGDDVNIFTINAASHVHIDVTMEEAVSAVNVLNGFAGAQIALTAHSNVWKGHLDKKYKCVNEKFWDWWMPDRKRIGVPEKPFKDMKDYIDTISNFKPVYVKRKGMPVLLEGYKTFSGYYNSGKALGKDINGKEIEIIPDREDIDIHNTCYWYNARLTGYYTVENRVNDQQPPEDILCVPALTLGLVSSLSNVQMDLYEEGDNVVAEVKAPGFEKDQLDIRVEANQLTVSGKVEEVKEDKDKKRKYYRKEMRNLSFTRTCDLPVSVDANKADASFKNGVLKVILPKKEEAKPKQIQVRLDK